MKIARPIWSEMKKDNFGEIYEIVFFSALTAYVDNRCKFLICGSAIDHYLAVALTT